MAVSVVDWETDADRYVGDHVDGASWRVRHGPDGWYVTVTVESETANSLDDIYSDQGPFPTEEEADQFGRGAAEDWCVGNGVCLGDDEMSALSIKDDDGASTLGRAWLTVP